MQIEEVSDDESDEGNAQPRQAVGVSGAGQQYRTADLGKAGGGWRRMDIVEVSALANSKFRRIIHRVSFIEFA